MDGLHKVHGVSEAGVTKLLAHLDIDLIDEFLNTSEFRADCENGDDWKC